MLSFSNVPNIPQSSSSTTGKPHNVSKEVSVLSVQPTFPNISYLHPETLNPNDFPAPELGGLPRV